METLGGAGPETYASRLRGSRFWIPLTLLVVAVAAGFYVLGRSTTTPTATTPPGLTSFDDPLLSRLIDTLEGNNLICADPISEGPRHATCQFNGLAASTEIRTFPTVDARMAWVRRQEVALNRIYLQDQTISYVIAGKKWALRGTWSAGGGYADTRNPDATVAQDVNKILDGCLELLPREAGSCAF